MVDAEQRGTVIVTGAAAGIGRAISKRLASDGWSLIIVDTDQRGVDTTASELSELNKLGGSDIGVQAFCTDVSSEDSILCLYGALSDAGISPTALINNAAVQTWAPLLELQLADWNKTLTTNLTGTFLMIREFARLAIAAECNASIINIGSGCNHLAFPNLVDYSASKGGVEMLTKSAALELGQYGIRVNCIAPGAIETERTLRETTDYAASWSPLTPMGRVGRVEDVADAVALMLDPGAEFISGQTLAVDGGLFSRAPWPGKY